MRAIIPALAVSLAFAQNVDRVLQFTHAETKQDIQEIATVIGSLTGLKQVPTDEARNALTLSGTAAQIDLGEWLFHDLGNPPAAVPPGQSPAKHEYRLPGGADDVVRVFYLQHAQTVQQLQEIATAVRSTAYLRLLFTYTAPRAIAMRGTSDQVGMAEWLLAELDRNPAPRVDASPEYRLPGGGENVLRVFHLRQSETIQDFQELVTLVRSITDIRPVFTYNSTRAVATRGTADQIALATWLFSQLDRPSNPQAPAPPSEDTAKSEYQFRGVGKEADTVVRVFYRPLTESFQRFQELAVQVRLATEIRRIFLYERPRALVLRGTASQIALADRLFKERDR